MVSSLSARSEIVCEETQNETLERTTATRMVEGFMAWMLMPNVADNRRDAAGQPGRASENGEAGASPPWLDCRGASG